MSLLSDKQALRKEAIRHRDRIDPAVDDAHLAAQNFLAAIQPGRGQVIALYYPKGREFDTLPLLHELLADRFSCALPVLRGDERALGFAAFHDGDPLEMTTYGLMQPQVSEATIWVDPDVFVIPLLAFDAMGHRLGYGKGHYDATLAHYRAIKPVTAVGYAYDRQEVSFELPADAHDQKLDWIITPLRAQRFG